MKPCESFKRGKGSTDQGMMKVKNYPRVLGASFSASIVEKKNADANRRRDAKVV